MANQYIEEDLFSGLHELTKSVFPKNCKCCGRQYRSLAEFLASTSTVTSGSSGLKQDQDVDGHIFVDMFRNSACGSTILESFLNRRDVRETGGMRRLQFQDRFDKLAAMAYLAEAGRGELLKRLRGQVFKNAINPLQIQKRKSA